MRSDRSWERKTETATKAVGTRLIAIWDPTRLVASGCSEGELPLTAQHSFTGQQSLTQLASKAAYGNAQPSVEGGTANPLSPRTSKSRICFAPLIRYRFSHSRCRNQPY